MSQTGISILNYDPADQEVPHSQREGEEGGGEEEEGEGGGKEAVHQEAEVV